MNLVLSLFALDLLGEGAWLLTLLLGFLLFGRKRLLFRGDFFLLTLFSVCYLMVDGWREMDFFYTVLFLPLAFLVGLNWKDRVQPSDLTRTMFLLAVSMAVHGVLNLLLAHLGGGEGYPDFWTGGPSAATAQMLLYALLAALAGSLLTGPRRRLWLLPLMLISLVHTVELGGRTLFVLLGLSLFVGAASGWVLVPEGRDRLLRRSAGLLGGGALSLAAVRANWAGAGVWFQGSHLYQRRFSAQALEREVSFFQTDRWAIKGEYLRRVVEHPFGGGELHREVGNYAHDLFLDVLDRGSVFAAALLIVYFVRAVCRWKNVVAVARPEDKVLFLCWGITVVAVLFVEPILQGAPLLLFSLVLLDGMAANLELQGRENG